MVQKGFSAEAVFEQGSEGSKRANHAEGVTGKGNCKRKK
jgi:hypothetical protein